jgi:hypothetical protein
MDFLVSFDTLETIFLIQIKLNLFQDSYYVWENSSIYLIRFHYIY